MKFYTLLLFVICINYYINAQPPSAAVLNCNKIQMWSNNINRLVDYNNSNASGGFNVNPESMEQPVSTIFLSNIMVLGYDKNNLRGIATMFSQENFSENSSFPGPLNSGINYKYNHNWKVNYWEIINHIKDYEDNQVIDSKPSDNILKWPGKNNPYSYELQGIEWDNKDYAPFFDRNNDNIYDPYAGDYPVLDVNCPVKIPDQMIYSIYHEIYGDDLEISKLIYAFQDDERELLNNSVFVKIKVLTEYDTFKNAKLSIFNDFDLGCPDNDLFGSSPERKTIYVYDRNEEGTEICSVQNTSINSFGQNPPIQSLSCLNWDKVGAMITYRESENNYLTDPHNLNETYNIMSSKWRDGTHLTYGNTGYEKSSNNLTNYPYSSSPSNVNGWSMYNSEIGGVDCRTFLNLDLGNLVKNEPVYLDFVYSIHPADLTTTHVNRVDSMLKNIDYLNELYRDCFIPSKNTELCESDCVWPGDTDKNGIVNNLDILNIGAMSNQNGFQRTRNDVSWKEQLADNWENENAENVNYKHIDCNGNGSINRSDIDVIRMNILEKNQSFTSWGGFNNSGNELYFQTDKNNYSEGEIIKAKMYLSSNDIFGFGTTIEYDTSVIEIASEFFNKIFDNENSPLKIILQEPGKVHFAIVKTLGNSMDYLNKDLGSIHFYLKQKISDTKTSKIKFTNYQKINNTGKISPLSSMEHSFEVNGIQSSTADLKNSLKVFPNPAKNEININYSNNIQSVTIMDQNGNKYYPKLRSGSLNISNLTSGFYIMQLKDVAGNIFNEKLIIE